MIPKVIRTILIRRLVLGLSAPLMGAVLRLDGLRRRSLLQTLRLAPFHRGVMRMRLFVVLAAGAAKKEENFLRVGTTHASSLRSWRVVVKRSIVARQRSLGWWTIDV
jgi:hypothetical protein